MHRHILILEDHPMMVDALKAGVQSLPFKTRVFVKHTLKDFVAGLETQGLQRLDVIILDLNLPDSLGLATLRAVREHCPGAAILVFSQFEGTNLEPQVLAQGACAYVAKSNAPKVMLSRLAHLLAKLPPLDAPSQLIEPADPIDTLTAQQRRVLAAIASGLNTDEAATQLEITAATLRSHLNDVFTKLKVKSRSQAVVMYLQWASAHGV